MVDKFTFWSSYADAALKMEDDARHEFMDAIINYVFRGEEPEFTHAIASAVFDVARPSIDTSIKQAAGGKKGGSSCKNTAESTLAEKNESTLAEKNESTLAEKNESTLEKNSKHYNYNYNNNYNNNNKGIMSAKADNSSQFVQKRKKIIEYLNNKLGSHFSVNSTKAKLIDARLKEGYTVEDCCKVIDNQYLNWANDVKMRAYLRPETLFGTKFDGYLNNTPPAFSCCKGYEVAPIVGGAYA